MDGLQWPTVRPRACPGDRRRRHSPTGRAQAARDGRGRTLRIGLRSARAVSGWLFRHIESAETLPLGRRSHAPIARPSIGNAARSKAPCAAIRSRFVRPGATITQPEIVTGFQPRSAAISQPSRTLRWNVPTSSLMSAMSVLSSIRSRAWLASCQATQIDDSALTEDRKRDFRHEAPARIRARERPRDRLVEPGMPGVQEAIEIPGPPAGQELEADVEGRSNPPNRVHRQRPDVPALNAGDRRLRHAGLRGQILLSPTATLADRPNHRSETLVIHQGLSVLAGTHLEITWAAVTRAATCARGRIRRNMRHRTRMADPGGDRSRIATRTIAGERRPGQGVGLRPRTSTDIGHKSPCLHVPPLRRRARTASPNHHQTARPFVIMPVDNTTPRRGQPTPRPWTSHSVRWTSRLRAWIGGGRARIAQTTTSSGQRPEATTTSCGFLLTAHASRRTVLGSPDRPRPPTKPLRRPASVGRVAAPRIARATQRHLWWQLTEQGPQQRDHAEE